MPITEKEMRAIERRSMVEGRAIQRSVRGSQKSKRGIGSDYAAGGGGYYPMSDEWANANELSMIGTSPQDIAKAKLKLQTGGLPGYDPEDFAGVRPGQEIATRLPRARPTMTPLKITVPGLPLKKQKLQQIMQVIARNLKKAGSTTGTTSGGSRSSGSGYGAGGYSSSYGSGGYQGGTYGGAAGASIGLGVGGAFKNR